MKLVRAFIFLLIFSFPIKAQTIDSIRTYYESFDTDIRQGLVEKDMMKKPNKGVKFSKDNKLALKMAECIKELKIEEKKIGGMDLRILTFVYFSDGTKDKLGFNGFNTLLNGKLHSKKVDLWRIIGGYLPKDMQKSMKDYLNP